MGTCYWTLCPGLEHLTHTQFQNSLSQADRPDSARMAFRFQPKNTTNTQPPTRTRPVLGLGWRVPWNLDSLGRWEGLVVSV